MSPGDEGNGALPSALEAALASLHREGLDDGAFERLCEAHPEHAARLREVRANLGELDAPAANHPRQIGPYRLLTLLGEGGMGTVYLAEQHAPVRRRVAIKLVKLGLDSREVVRRFQAEQQALALMEHPNIARVIDAGIAADGRPYFAMEHVKGVPLTQFCDSRKASLELRLDLFRQVCAGVQHAHSKGVIHRDLKPTNVLVTDQDGERPVAKIIDFGLARATDHRLVEATLFTELGQIVGTPEYMSPEQAGLDGLDIDTRTDVYSLGVMLYELLTGVLPFDAGDLRRVGLLEIQRRIREDEPPRPSTRFATLGDRSSDAATRRQTTVPALSRTLRGELDWIVLKAMEKDRARRYGTAEALAEDVLRFLQGEPVQARPPSVAYRTRKLLVRHRFLVTGAAAVFVSLLAGLVVSVGLYRESEANATRAAEERDAKNVQLRRTQALLLAHNSQQVLPSDAPLATLLAHEGVTRLRVAETSNALRAALERLHERRTLLGHTGFVRTAGFSADGSKVVTAGDDFTARLFDAEDGRALPWLVRHEGAIRHAVFDPRGERVLTASATDGTIRITSLRSPEDQVVVPVVGVTAVLFDASGQRVVTGDADGELAVWGADTGRRIATLRGHRDAIVSLHLGRDGRMVSASRDRTVRVWDPREAHGEVTPLETESCSKPLSAAWFCGDGSRVVAQEDGGRSWVWESGQPRLRPIGPRSSNAILPAPDGATVVIASPADGVQAWSLDSGEPAGPAVEGADLTAATRAAITSAHPERAFDRAGAAVLVGTKDHGLALLDPSTGDTVRIVDGQAEAAIVAQCDPTTDRILAGFDLSRLVHLCASRPVLDIGWTAPAAADLTQLASTDGASVLTTSTRDGMVVLAIVDPRTGQTRAVGVDASGSVAIAPDGGAIATVDGTTLRYATLPLAGEPRTIELESEALSGVTFSPDGRRIAINVGGTVRVIDPLSGATTARCEGRAEPREPMFDPTGRRLLFEVQAEERSGTRRLEFLLCDAATGADLRSFGLESPFAHFGANGTRALCRERTPDGIAVAIRDVAGELETQRIHFPAEDLLDAAMDPAGRRIAAALPDGTVHLVPVDGQGASYVLRGHDANVERLRFSGDGDLLVGCGGRSVQVWEAASGAELLTVPCAETALDARIVADGAHPGAPFLLVQAADGQGGARIRAVPLDLVPLASDRLPRELTYKERVRFGLLRDVDVAANELVGTEMEPGDLVESVIRRIRARPGVDLRVADRAVEIAIERGDPSAKELNTRAWRTVWSRGRPRQDYESARELAETAHRMAPAEASIANTLGVALYRCGRHAEAHAALEESVRLAHGMPSSEDLAFLVLTLRAMDRPEEEWARWSSQLEEVRGDEDAWGNEEERLAILTEVDDSRSQRR